MRISTLINRDARCPQCDYNLRGLTLDGDCPECGTPILRSFRYHAPGIGDDARRRRAAVLERVAGLTELSVDAMDFTLDLLLVATVPETDAGGEPAAAPRHAAGRDVCGVLAEYAKYHFGGEDEALLALEAMGLTSSEQLGRVVFALVDAGLLKAQPGDAPADFEGLFTLDTLYAGR